MTASHNGHVEVVDKLLQHEATVDLQSKVINPWPTCTVRITLLGLCVCVCVCVCVC